MEAVFETPKKIGVYSLKDNLLEFVPENIRLKFQTIKQIVDYLAHNSSDKFPDWIKKMIKTHKQSGEYNKEYKFPKWKTPVFPIVDAPYLVIWDGVICSRNAVFGTNKRVAIPQKIKDMVKERDNYTCQYCGNSVEKEPNLLLEVDHIIPFSLGGSNEPDNLQTLCWRCNRSKSNKME